MQGAATGPTPPTSVSLSTNRSSYTAGQHPTVAATVDQDVSGVSEYLVIYDLSMYSQVAACSTGVTCSADATLYSGEPQTFAAYVTASNTWGAWPVPAPLLVSNTVSVTRAGWTSGLTSDKTTFVAGDTVTLTATAMSP